MVDRLDQINSLLAEAGWSNALHSPMNGDLSTRRYSRVRKAGKSAVLMDAEYSMAQFASMANWLRQAGFSAPKILAGKPESGLLLIEDFGNTTLNAFLLKNPNQSELMQKVCIKLLLSLRKTEGHSLACPSASDLVLMTKSVNDYYPGINISELSRFYCVLEAVLEKALKTKLTLSLRDFHAENIMWLPDRSGLKKFGLLDFQDAFLTHPAYDLVSFLTDARVDVTSEYRNKSLQDYIALSGHNRSSFETAFAAFSVQRNLRILGIFSHGAISGRGHHVDKIPRVHGYLEEALEHPVFDTVRTEVLAALPDPQFAMTALTR